MEYLKNGEIKIVRNIDFQAKPLLDAMADFIQPELEKHATTQDQVERDHTLSESDIAASRKDRVDVLFQDIVSHCKHLLDPGSIDAVYQVVEKGTEWYHREHKEDQDHLRLESSFSKPEEDMNWPNFTYDVYLKADRRKDGKTEGGCP